MPKENNNIVPVLDALNNVSGETGDKKVDKNIIESDARQGGRKSTKKKDPNSGGEKIYFTKIATIFGETFKKINKPKDTAIETDIEGEPESPVEKATQLAMPKMEKKKKGMLAVMAGILLAVGTLAFFLHDQLSPVFRFLSKAIFKIIPVFKSLWHIFGTLIKGTKVFQKVVGWFKPILGIIGKATTAIKAIPGGGGLLKLLSGIGAKVGTKLLKVLKFIPYIGAVINFGFAFAKFKKGDWVGGIMEIIAGILGLLPPPVPILGMIMDGIILVRDMKMAKKKKEGDAGGEAKQGILESIGKKVGGWLLTVAEMLPVIGGLILSGKAIFAFIDGDLKRGFIYLGRAFISYIGLGFFAKGIGFMISLFAGKKKKEEGVPKEEGGLSKIAKKVAVFLLMSMSGMPVLGGIILSGQAILAFIKGDLKQGFIFLGRAFISYIGLGFFAKGIGFMISLLAGKKKKEKDVKEEGGLGKMVKSIGGWLFKTAENLPGIGGFILFGKAIAAFIGGDIGKGLALFGRGILAFFVGGKGADLIIKGVGALIGFAKNAGKKLNIKFPSFDVIGKIASWISEKVRNFVNGIWDGIWGIIKGIWTALVGAGKWLLEKMNPKGAFDGFMEFVGKIKDWILGIPGRVLNFLKDKIIWVLKKLEKIPIVGKMLAGKLLKKVTESGGSVSKDDVPKGEEKEEKKKKGIDFITRAGFTLTLRQLSRIAAIQENQLSALKVQSKLSAIGSIRPSKGLDRIASISHAQLQTMTSVKELLQEMLNTMKPGGASLAQPANWQQKLQQVGERFAANISGGNEPVNNDSMEGDSRGAYNLSPYSINVPA